MGEMIFERMYCSDCGQHSFVYLDNKRLRCVECGLTLSFINKENDDEEDRKA
jgi:ribosomal protein S27AE